MPIAKVNSGDIITSTAWNSLVDEINLKVNRAGDTMTGPLRIGNGQSVFAPGLIFTDPTTNAPYLHNSINMANNIEGATKWLHIGGITDGDAVRRIALFADRTFVSGRLGIGTTAPTVGRLEINHNSAFNNTHIALRETEPGDFARISLQSNTEKAWHIAGRSDVNPMFNIWHVDYGDVISMYAPEKRVSINPGWKLRLGNALGQRIDLWETGFGVGIQHSTLYFRTDAHYYWYMGGVHDDNAGAASGGGREMMSLRNDGILRLTDGPGSIGRVSDRKLKKNIKSLEGALDKLSQLRGVTFEWKDSDARIGQNGTQTGLIAQEVETVFPEWTWSFDGCKGIALKGFDALVIESIKELKNQIEAIKKSLKI